MAAALSELSYFLLNVQFPPTPTDIATRVLAVSEHWHAVWETSRGPFSPSILPRLFFITHITACRTSSLCSQLDTVAYHFHYSQSLPLYFMLVSPCPQFRFLSTFPLPLHVFFSSSVSCPVRVAFWSWKTSLHTSSHWPRVWMWAQPDKQREFFFFFLKETETGKQGGKPGINRDLVLSNRKSGEPKDRQCGYFSLFLC